MERWKPVPGYEGLYDVSDKGRVRSWHKGGRYPGQRKDPKIIIPFLCNEYLKIGLWENGNRKKFYVHRLVLLSFIGPCLPNMECCHMNGNKKDNKLENLRWDTHLANEQDKIMQGISNHGEHNGSSKLTENQVREIRRLYTTGDYLQRELGTRFKVNQTTIGKIVRREKWAHVKGQ